jgi:enamine deaminase RidA (YjgF/YER057c/UK114 family)
MKNRIALAAWLGAAATLPVHADNIQRRPTADFPIASSVTVSAGSKLARELEALGLSMADVVKMNVYLVGDPRKDGMMDFAGLMKAYLRHFGTEAQKNLPARTTVQVAGLPLPGALVEIELIAAR